MAESYFEKLDREQAGEVGYQRVLCYTKLFALLHEKRIKQQDLEERAGISSSTMNKLRNDKPVNTNMLEKICTALDCEISDIVETKRVKETEKI